MFLTHGRAANRQAVRAVNETVHDGVSNSGILKNIMPGRYWHLAGERSWQDEPYQGLHDCDPHDPEIKSTAKERSARWHRAFSL